VDKESRLKAIRYLIVEFVIYGVLVTLYAVTVLTFLADPLKDLYYGNLTAYAFLALFLIAAQGVLLAEVKSFLMDRLRLSRFD
jgi:hypothetical protein